MLYIPYFEYAGAILITIIGLIFLSRRTFLTRSSLYFSLYCIVVLMVAIADIISVYTISFPEQYPLWLNYIVNEWFYFSVISAVLVYLLYTDSLAKIPALEKPIHWIVRIVVIMEAIICLTNPWTKLVIYFDENLQYQRGPFFNINYLIAIIAIAVSIGIIIKGRVKFSVYQRFILILFCVGIVISNVIQIICPYLLLTAFEMSIMAFFIYIAFENPAYFFYKDTRCQNRDAFLRFIKLRMQSGAKTSLVIGMVRDYAELSKSLRSTQKENLYRFIADKLSFNFKRNAFLIGSDHFIVSCASGSADLSKEKAVEEKMKQILSTRVNISDRKINLVIDTAILPAEYEFKSVDELEGVIEILLSTVGENVTADAYEKAEIAIKRKHRQEELEHIVERAMEEDSFFIYYQPIINVETGKYESAEALVRLIDKKEGFISPEEFIPVTEKAGLILPLGEMIFRKVCMFINSIDTERLGIKYIEVNLSPLQCEKKDISDTLFSIMAECKTDPHMINFEITETAEAEFAKGSQIVENIIQMNQKGVSFSIDDFGSGFSAMDHLFQVPVDLVKVDKSILWQAMEDKNAMIVLKNTFNMVQELNKKILVEGVETQEMVDILKKYGCHYMQGYFFSKPIPEADYVKFLEEHNLG